LLYGLIGFCGTVQIGASPGATFPLSFNTPDSCLLEDVGAHAT